MLVETLVFFACLNDQEVRLAEQEFRERYRDVPGAAEAPPPATGRTPAGGFVILGAGVALIGSAIFFSRRRG